MRLQVGVILVIGAVLSAACGRTVAGNTASTASTAATSAVTSMPAGGGKGQPPAPTDYPAAPQSLGFFGDVDASITTGRPTSCGYGSGPDNFMVFAFGLYFQVGSSWYLFNADTDQASGPYRGPATYSARGTLSSLGSLGPNYEGRVQLTIVSDRVPDSGRVEGTLQAATGNGLVKVSGGWTCSPGPELGPA